MFTDSKINVPVLGLVENMAWFTPEAHPDERYYIFGNGGAQRLAEEYKVPLLACIPLVAAVGQRSDNGEPIALGDSIAAQAFLHLAHEVIDAVDRRNRELPPTTKVELRH
ncbi:MAG: Mrp/NBP35 family ATP-binding protein, partial [Muribaculaceae bacterium]|nr:Mrp/NBP35 family ATP-binding protein [Muribaculaceae bacterium]